LEGGCAVLTARVALAAPTRPKMRIPQALEGRPSCSVPAPGLSLSPSGEDISSGPRTFPTSRFELDTEGRGRPGSCFPDQTPLPPRLNSPPASAGLRRPAASAGGGGRFGVGLVGGAGGDGRGRDETNWSPSRSRLMAWPRVG
jgi:hypothetical protein